MSRYLLVFLLLFSQLISAETPEREFWYLMTDAKDFDKVIGVYQIREFVGPEQQRRLDIDIEVRVKVLFMNFDASSDFSVYFEGDQLARIDGSTRRSNKTSTINATRHGEQIRVKVSKKDDTESVDFPASDIATTEYELMLPLDLGKFPEGETITTPTLFAELQKIVPVTWHYRGMDNVSYQGKSRQVHLIERDNTQEEQTLWVDEQGTILAEIGKRAALVLGSEARAKAWKQENLGE